MRNKMNVLFSPPDITQSEIDEVVAALKSGWITTGPRTKKFEENICKYLGVNNCVCLNSQTACAELSLHILGIGPGDEVIVPAYTYTASASVVAHVGAKIILCDSQPDNYEMDYDKVESLINERTKAIIPVDIGGVPCDYDRLFKIVEKKKKLFKPNSDYQKALGRIAIVADTAHAFGATYHGQMLGHQADFSNFSFHAVKNLTTAEGGCCVWNSVPGIDDAETYHMFQLLSLHGQSKDALHKNQPGSWEYDIVGTWYKCNMTDVVAAVGIRQLERYPQLIGKRMHIIEKYDAAFKPFGCKVLDHFNNSHTSSGHLYLVRVPGIGDKERREMIIKMAELGVSCNVHYKPLPMHTAYKQLGYDIKDFPNAYHLYENEITLPLHTCLTDEEVSYVIECFTEVLKEYVK